MARLQVRLESLALCSGLTRHVYYIVHDLKFEGELPVIMFVKYTVCVDGSVLYVLAPILCRCFWPRVITSSSHAAEGDGEGPFLLNVVLDTLHSFPNHGCRYLAFLPQAWLNSPGDTHVATPAWSRGTACTPA